MSTTADRGREEDACTMEAEHARLRIGLFHLTGCTEIFDETQKCNFMHIALSIIASAGSDSRNTH